VSGLLCTATTHTAAVAAYAARIRHPDATQKRWRWLIAEFREIS